MLVDDGTEAALRSAATVMKFRKAYFANGKLMVKRADTGALMGRCDAFLPTNVDMGGTLRNFEAIIRQLTDLADKRAAGAGTDASGTVPPSSSSSPQT